MYKGFHGFKLLQIDGAGVNEISTKVDIRFALNMIKTLSAEVLEHAYRNENRGAYDRLLAPKIIDS